MRIFRKRGKIHYECKKYIACKYMYTTNEIYQRTNTLIVQAIFHRMLCKKVSLRTHENAHYSLSQDIYAAHFILIIQYL